jgi:hypothetical protein
MMSNKSPDAGVIQALVERFEKQRFPRALALKEKVDGGAVLSNADVAFLREVFDDAQYIGPLVERHPEWQPIAARMMHLYQEITTKALENEKGG